MAERASEGGAEKSDANSLFPGRAADAIRLISNAGIGISYLYSFMLSGKGILIFRTDNAEKTNQVIQENNLIPLDSDKLLALV